MPGLRLERILFALLWATGATSFLAPSRQQRSAMLPHAVRTAVNVNSEREEQEFLKKCRDLCERRNFPFETIKNARDLGSTNSSAIQPGRIYRMGRLGDASDRDLEILNDLQIKTLIDLRSPTELKDDSSLFNPNVYGDYTNLLWKEQGRFRDGCLVELQSNEGPVRRRFWQRKASSSTSTTPPLVTFSEEDDAVLEEVDQEIGLAEETECNMSKPNQKERHFCSLMNEFKYVKGTVSKLRKRDITKAILTSPGAMFSKRMRHALKKPFLDEINDGGLPMLNELLLRFGAPGIRYVLEVCADKSRHPVAFYCTAGKDRTGVLAAIILALNGVEVEDIVEDYMLSANVYAEMNDHKAMVGALSQRNLDPKTFLGAPPSVMRDTLKAVDEEYGSIEGYCNWIGFGPEKQEQLRQACQNAGTLED